MSYLVQTDSCPYVTYKADTPRFHVDKNAVDESQPLPYKDNSFDLVISNLNLHWVNDLDKSCREILRVLKPDGAFVGAIWGNDSLYELRQSIQLAEMERRGGVVPRVGPLTRGDSFSAVLHGSGFKLITCDYYEEQYGYPSLFELVEDLQNSGESQCAFNFRPLHPDILMSAAAIYQVRVSFLFNFYLF
jgi:NADH dehydrogenase [ubiquinone] 1 alpha subcomplex assembly factor 5